MKSFLLALLLGTGALIPSTSAISITFDQAGASGFAFDVIWGPFLVPPDLAVNSGADIGLAALDLGSAVHVSAAYIPPGPPYYLSMASFSFPSATSRAYVTPSLSGNVSPLSVSPTSDGFGANFVYGKIPPPSHNVPDGGLSTVLLMIGAVGCAGVRKLLDR